MSNIVYESHSIAPGAPNMDWVEKVSVGLSVVGLLVLGAALFTISPETPAGVRTALLTFSYLAVAVGTITFGLRKHLGELPGVRNHGKNQDNITSRGLWGWIVGVILTGFYVMLYWFPQTLSGLIALHDPLSQFMRGKPADQWFVYGTFYTAAILFMGVKALAKYRFSRYHFLRTCSIMFVQLAFAFIIPAVLAKLSQPEIYLSYLWPLAYDKLFPSSIESLTSSGAAIGFFFVGWFLIGTLIATPFLTYFYGKRWYCSWVCGCGGLANTLGDPWRHLSDKSTRAWVIERWLIYTVLVWIVLLTALLWFAPAFPESFQGFLGGVKGLYGFIIGAAFAGVAGVGFYPLLGSRVWCRFGCPMAAILGILQRINSRFRITTNGGQCISCGNCSEYCEMGIDVKAYAQRGENIIRASCVGCGMCAAVCPRGVLSLENGPKQGRYNGPQSLLGKHKSGAIEG